MYRNKETYLYRNECVEVTVIKHCDTIHTIHVFRYFLNRKSDIYMR